MKREEEIQALNEELNDHRSKAEQTDLEMKKFVAGKQKMMEEIELSKRKNAEKEEKYHVKKRTLDLLPDADNNIKMLKVGLLELPPFVSFHFVRLFFFNATV